MRRVPLRNGTNGTSNGGIIVVPPIVPPPVEPPIADWADITELFACARVAPDEAPVAANGLFTATPGADLTANYAWEINTAGMTIPHVCCVIPTDLAVFFSELSIHGGRWCGHPKRSARQWHLVSVFSHPPGWL
jgi:hypothetical protein